MILAVDGDIIAYRTAAVCETHFEKSCENVIDKTLQEVAGDTGINNMRIYLSSPENFRKYIGTTQTYKGNRDGLTRPQFLEHCKDYLRTKFKAICHHGYEADDCIATDMVKNGAIHCGIDKDILQIPGRHFNYVTKDWKNVSPEEAKLTLYRQILMGDTSDNIPGLPGIGVKKAEAFVHQHDNAFSQAVSVYRAICAKSLPDLDAEKYFVEQMTLISMITDVPLRFDNTVYVKAWGLTIEEIQPIG